MDSKMMMMKNQVLSWLNDEESVVTSQRINQQHSTLSLSRKDASSLLQSIWEEEPDDEKYHVTLCVMDTTTTTRKDKEGNDDEVGDDCAGYSTTGTCLLF
jgi:hypothetical protein